MNQDWIKPCHRTAWNREATTWTACKCNR